MYLNPGDTILNHKYRIERQLGQGAFARVYLARHLALDVERAVKIVSRDAPGVGSSLFSDFAQRFQLEAQLGARLDHPHVIKVYDFEADDEGLCLVMEYAPGGSLADRLRDGPLSIDDFLRIAIDAASGLGAIHEQLQAVHRDIKPSNILLDGNGRAKIGDLGLAQAPGGWSQRSVLDTQARFHPGTPQYMSPEQEREYAYLQPPSDVYGLGCVYFEMLTGRPYRTQRPGTRVQDLRREAPEWLDEVVMRCLAEERGDRPWDGNEVAELLRAGQRSSESRAHEGRRTAAGRPQEAGASIAGAVAAAVMGGACPICGAFNQAEKTFRCNQCGQEFLCLEHRDPRTYLCSSCTEEAVREQQEAERRQRERLGLQVAGVRERAEAALRAEQWAEARGLAEEWLALEPGAQRGQAIIARAKLALEGPPLRRTPSGLIIAGPGNVAWLLAQSESPARVWWEKANMELCLVPAGEFQMGSPEGAGYDDERPQHTVYLDGYYVGRYPVTVAQFRRFLSEAGHTPESSNCLKGQDDHPVVYVSWHDATAYGEWAGLRLPAEAEWEKAARGTDGRVYPWGNEAPDRSLCNFGRNEGGRTPVGKYSPQGDSPYDCADMAGDAWEWCGDWKDSGYYVSSPSKNPTGPSSGGSRVVRGGSWYDDPFFVRCAYRNGGGPDITNLTLGFRCARGS